MDMNRAFFLRKEDQAPKWWIIDAEGLVLGRLATRLADILRGKNKALYTPHSDGGDYVVVINADKVKLTGDKLEQKEYARYSGWIGGLKITTAEQMLQKHPTHLVEAAVKGMLPKNRLSRQVFGKLKVYAGAVHPHAAQSPEKLV